MTVQRKLGRGAGAEAPPPSGVEASIAARIARLTAALGDPFREDPRLAHYLVALEQMDAAPPRARPRAPSAELLARLDALLAAHEIAASLSPRGAAWGERGDAADRAAALFDVEAIRRGQVRTLGALEELETGLFTYWNEAPFSETRAFWRAVERAGLPFVRRDLLGEIMQRGRITSREHYEYAVDVLGVAEDEGLLDAARAARLAQMIGAFEGRGSRAARGPARG